jgi:hypothetical protein
MFMAKAIAAAVSAAILTYAAPYLSPLGQQALGDTVGVIATVALGGGLSGLITYLIPNRAKK